MITLISTLTSFLAGGLPKLLDFFQDKSDKKHELALAQIQREKELEAMKLGFLSQQKVEEIRTDQIALQTAVQEREAIYKHDIDISKGASQWVVNARAMVRPAITYGLFILFCFVEVAGFVYAWKMGAEFTVMLDQLWDDETQLIWSSVVAFWFGTQAFGKK
jgi:hypothetical protein